MSIEPGTRVSCYQSWTGEIKDGAEGEFIGRIFDSEGANYLAAVKVDGDTLSDRLFYKIKPVKE